jgi:hypothetical protein
MRGRKEKTRSWRPKIFYNRSTFSAAF